MGRWWRYKWITFHPSLTLYDIYSSIGCALSSFHPSLGPPFDFLLNICSCQTANCFNKSKGVFITDPKLKALLNPQPSWGFSGHK
ncbi:hypothetical protein GCK68_19470 [Yersinia pestis]|nr:hypothetical protein GCK68_19470 [Yersinia pestis]